MKSFLSSLLLAFAIFCITGCSNECDPFEDNCCLDGKCDTQQVIDEK